jgi:hypothetical protein
MPPAQSAQRMESPICEKNLLKYCISIFMSIRREIHIESSFNPLSVLLFSLVRAALRIHKKPESD